MNKTAYDPATGRIFGAWVADAAVYSANESEERQFVDKHWESTTHYILNGQPTERPTSPVTRTDLTLLAVPEGSTLWINGESYAAEGEVELEFPLPGTYRLRVECFPFLDWADEVVV